MDTPIVQPPTPPLTQPVHPSPKNNSGIFIGILVFILGILTGVAFTKTTILSDLRIPHLSATPTTIPFSTPSLAPDPTADWKTYTNTTQKVTFKYPASWSLTESPGQTENGKEYNASVRLTKGNAVIHMIFNVDGIGGISQTYEGKNFILDGYSLFQFNRTNTYNNTKEVGISDSLTTLGFFMVNNITYLITISYPVNQPESSERALLEEFDQILSTFRFTDTTSSQQVLGIQPTQCCSCPTMIDASLVGTNGWVAYEQGKDYSTQQPELCSQPNIGVCAPCPTIVPTSFTCPANGWVDCMPGPIAKPECSAEAMTWYKTNCPDFKGGAL